jgi:hypothetical protein
MAELHPRPSLLCAGVVLRIRHPAAPALPLAGPTAAHRRSAQDGLCFLRPRPPQHITGEGVSMQRVLRDHSLSLVMFGLFMVFLVGQSVTGSQVYNDDQREHGEPAIAYVDYLQTGHFIEATFENWESEYLQMGAYVLFTVFLFQRGSSESKDPDKDESVDEDPRQAQNQPNVPWPVRYGGPVLRLYEHSLTIALLLLFAGSFLLHAIGGAREYSQEQLAHGGSAVSTLEFLRTSAFWFQSFQNWQSEFLAVFSLVALSIVLRQRGSPESKPVAAPLTQTGTA